jgi:hypothetical protein
MKENKKNEWMKERKKERKKKERKKERTNERNTVDIESKNTFLKKTNTNNHKMKPNTDTRWAQSNCLSTRSDQSEKGPNHTLWNRRASKTEKETKISSDTHKKQMKDARGGMRGPIKWEKDQHHTLWNRRASNQRGKKKKKKKSSDEKKQMKDAQGGMHEHGHDPGRDNPAQEVSHVSGTRDR